MRTWFWLGLAALGGFVIPCGAADNPAIEKAIDRGVAFLRTSQGHDGSWVYADPATTGIGSTALAGLTLLECGAKTNDPAVQKAATFVRDGCPTLTHTYSLSLSIMFLDRLGEAADVPLIESMAVRLLAGQVGTGGWDYTCPDLAPNEVQRLQTVVRNRKQAAAGADEPRAARREYKDLPREIQAQLEQVVQLQNQANAADLLGTGSDNSNTQFVTLALWGARRHGIPVQKALARIEARYRGTQGKDGGWSYTPLLNMPNAPVVLPLAGIPGMGSTPAMTCAGLIGLAAGTGSANEAVLRANPNKIDPTKPGGGGGGAANPPALRDVNKDPAIRAGLAALASAIGLPAGARVPPGVGQIQPGADGFPVIGPRQNAQGYYFLWSLERVAVAYGLETIGNKDWYAWGSQILLANQGQDGSWSGEYAQGGVDTCFALLFLRRANLAQDLTANLKGKDRELKAGGIGGTDLEKGVGLKPALDAGGDKNAGAKPATPEVKDKPPVEVEGEAGQLARELVKATGKRQDEILEKLRDSKGATYTQALTSVIPSLAGPVKTKARDALAERLTRMTAATLKEKLQDDDLEVRRAAALAVAMKEDKTFVPRLIEMLKDPEAAVSRAAQAALKSLTSQHFGPAPEATVAERDKAIGLWKAWWEKQPNK